MTNKKKKNKAARGDRQKRDPSSRRRDVVVYCFIELSMVFPLSGFHSEMARGRDRG